MGGCERCGRTLLISLTLADVTSTCVLAGVQNNSANNLANYCTFLNLLLIVEDRGGHQRFRKYVRRRPTVFAQANSLNRLISVEIS